MVRFALRQVTSLVDQANMAPLYRVINQVTETTGASPAVFVYKVATKTFEHYASAADMATWPDSYEEAFLRGLLFYRLDSVSRTWPTVQDMNLDLTTTVQRVQLLANELTQLQAPVVIDRMTTIQGA